MRAWVMLARWVVGRGLVGGEIWDGLFGCFSLSLCEVVSCMDLCKDCEIRLMFLAVV